MVEKVDDGLGGLAVLTQISSGIAKTQCLEAY